MTISTKIERFRILILELCDHAQRSRDEYDLAQIDRLQSELLSLGATLSSDAMHCCSCIDDFAILIQSLGNLRQCTEIFNDKLRCDFHPSDIGYFDTRRLFFSSTGSMSPSMQSKIRLYRCGRFEIRAVDGDDVLLATGCGQTKRAFLKDLITPS
jgi:hypothetical protein